MSRTLARTRSSPSISIVLRCTSPTNLLPSFRSPSNSNSCGPSVRALLICSIASSYVYSDSSEMIVRTDWLSSSVRSYPVISQYRSFTSRIAPLSGSWTTRPSDTLSNTSRNGPLSERRPPVSTPSGRVRECRAPRIRSTISSCCVSARVRGKTSSAPASSTASTLSCSLSPSVRNTTGTVPVAVSPSTVAAGSAIVSTTTPSTAPAAARAVASSPESTTVTSRTPAVAVRWSVTVAATD